MPAPLRKLAVIGGGWAGIAAAVEATRLGHQVTLFEMAPQLGGRARSVQVDEHTLDNGQHILIGAYRATLALMRTVGLNTESALLRMPLRLVTPEGSGLQLRAGPPALAFARAVMAHPRWTLGERMALLAAATGWGLGRFRCDAAMTVAELTRRLPLAIRSELIDPLCVAALNTPASAASGQVFLRVLHDAVFSGRGSADLLLPRNGLSELLPDAAAAWLMRQGASVQLHRRIDALHSDGERWRLDGERFDGIVLAASPTESARLTREIAPAWSQAAGALRFEPIVTVYARSAGTRLPHPMLALACDDTRPAQFVFDRGQLGGAEGLLAFVASGAQAWVERGLEATTDATLSQGREALRVHMRGPLTLLHAIAEKRATFACTPGLQRPAARIAPGLVGAGDYINGPYPATLEGAVISGSKAIMLLT